MNIFKKIVTVAATVLLCSIFANGQTDEYRQLPTWYPEGDLSSFVDFHDYEASRVVDEAHIFSEYEIDRMKEIIEKIQKDYNIDLVVATDSSSYGLDHDMYAMDFHHFCGYGFGDDFTGSILFICMEEGNRGWWTAATGKCESIYTYDVINSLDDKLEPYMVAGDYAEGVIDYLNNVYELYRLPDWYPDNVDDFIPFYAKYKSHVIDDVNYFTKEQLEVLASKAEEISSLYDTDFVIMTTPATIRGGNIYDYVQDYLLYNGYGVGEDRDAFVFCVLMHDDGYYAWNVVPGSSRDCYSYENMERILDHIQKPMDAGKIYDGALEVFKQADKMYRRGKVLPVVHFFKSVFWGIILGLIAAGITVSRMMSGLNNVRAATGAELYYEDGTFKLTNSDEKFLTSHVTKTLRESSSSSSSRSHSSHSSHSSSGGRSYSGGGRKF